MGLLLSAIAFVGTHFLLSHPLRSLFVRTVGEGPFRGIYSLVAILTFAAMIYFYRKIGIEPPLWVAGSSVWIVATILMWIGSILFVGSLIRNPALPGARGPSGPPSGVFAITRHPMMWGFAIWALVHAVVIDTPKALVLDAAILLLALGGAVAQDRKKEALMGARWHQWTAQTAFVPFTRGVANPGIVALAGGTLLFVIATLAHPVSAGFWRWVS
jgi:uncharacterized membrane protein